MHIGFADEDSTGVLKFCPTVASKSGTQSERALAPAVVRIPLDAILSFSENGIP